MSFDRFSILYEESRPIKILINGVPLLEMVREAEESLVRAEHEERIARGEDTEGYRILAGDYHYAPHSMILLPSRNLLDEPYRPGFVLKPDDPRIGKATVLGCTCGVMDCWLLQVRVTLSRSSVRWSEFGQFHRPRWKYNIGPFLFDRGQYESELARGT